MHREVEVPDGDILIHAGDVERNRETDATYMEDFSRWMASLPHRRKFLVPGNHDFYLEQRGPGLPEFAERQISILQDRAVVTFPPEIELLIYGSPYTPAFMNWAFMLPRRSAQLSEKWRAIPDETQILVTHGPPHGILDRTIDGDQAGCEALKRRVSELDLKLHVFGHIHEQGGTQMGLGRTVYVNASVVNERYELVNAPIVVDL